MKGGGEHRRGRSMGSTTPRPDSKDEDLALFHEMKRREKHNFLHPSPDDLDVSLSSKFGVMETPVKKSGTDLLTSDADKNDYDWLLTPPGTPLFPSLDQEASALGAISPRASHAGPSSANSSKLSHSPADPSPKSTRGNPSPRRAGSTTPNGTMSRSRSTPHNSTSVVAAVARPSTPTSSATRPSTPTAKSSSTPSVRASTPNLKLSISATKSSSSTTSTPTATRPSTPNARSSTPPVRPSTPGARSSTPTSKPSTPTMRRSLSGGRIASPATTRGGPSPKRTTSSRGNSPSAKRVTSVITTVPGMCSEAPPNLRTTVPERTSSTPKSSTSGPRSASESGHAYDAVDASGRSRRRPRSPSVSRSFSSSSSQDQRTSSQTSRGSVISSYDDGIEVSRPTVQSSRNSAAGKWHAAGHEDLLSGKANTNVQAKRVTKSLVISSSSPGGTPTKKSLEPNKWQGDAYQHSPSSYRHLVASSPGSPFYSSRANSLLVRPASAMNSSVTTSSNASSEHGTTVAPDTEGSERDDDDLLSWDSYGRRTSPSPRGQQADILMLDKDEEKLGAWRDYERLSGNDLVASYRPAMQSTLDSEVTSFYENDGMASFEMLEQLGVMSEVYSTKNGTPGERVLERRASNIEESKSELRRSGERTLQRRASNIDDSRTPDVRRSDDGSGLARPTNSKSSNDGRNNPGQQGLKSKRQELLDSLSDNRKFGGDVHKNTGGKALGSQKNKVSSAEIHAACLFVRDFRVGLAPSQGQETVSAVSHVSSSLEEEAQSTNWDGDGGGSIMNRKDFGGVRETHDFSQQKAKGSGAESDFAQVESKLPRRPQTRGKVGKTEPDVSHIPGRPSKADDLRAQANKDGANSSALSVLVDVMERIKQESSQPKYLELENQDSKRKGLTGAVVDDSVSRASHSGVSEIKSGLRYEEIHAMDEVDTPELHDIEDDSLMYDGGKDELELLDSLHRSALRKEEVRAMGLEMTNGSPKRRFITPEEAEMSSLEVDELRESPKRRCVGSTGDVDMFLGDGVVVNGSPSVSHEEADVAVTSMEFDDPLRRDEPELEVRGGDAEESAVFGESPLQPEKNTEQNHVVLPTGEMVVISAFQRSKEETVAGVVINEPQQLSSTGVCAFEKEDCTSLIAVVSLSTDRMPDLAVAQSDADLEQGTDGKVEDSPLCAVVDNSSRSEVVYQVHSESRKKEPELPEQTSRVFFDAQCGESTAVTSNIAYCSNQEDKHSNERTFSDDSDVDTVRQNVGDRSPLLVDVAEEERPDHKVPDGTMEEDLPRENFTSPNRKVDECTSCMFDETGNGGSQVDQPTQLSAQFPVDSTEEKECSGNHDAQVANESKIVNNDDEIHSEEMLAEIISEATNGKGHQEGGGVASSESEGSTAPHAFDGRSEEYQAQVKESVPAVVPDIPYVMERSNSSADEMACGEEHDKSRGSESRSIELLSPESGKYFAEDMDSSEDDDIISVASVDSLYEGTSVAGPVFEIPSLSKADRLDSPDVFSGNLNDGRSHDHLGDPNFLEKNETRSSGEVLRDAAPNHWYASHVTGSELLPHKVTGTDVFLSNACEPSPKYNLIEGSHSVEYVDTMSMETSTYYEATSEEKEEDSQEVSSGISMERKDVTFVHPRMQSGDHWEEGTCTVPSSLSEMRNARRSASSLCAALEEQLAGLIQKIDSAIEESSKPLVSGQQEGGDGRDKLSARTSDLLREQEPDELLQPGGSSQGEDLLDMLWAEDDDSGDSEGYGGDEFSQLQDPRTTGMDGSPNQVNGEIRLSRSSDNGLTLHLNGQTEVLPCSAKATSPVLVEEDRHHMESPTSLVKNDENVKDFDVTSPERHTAGSSGDTTLIPVSVGLKQQGYAGNPQLNVGVLLDNDVSDDGDRQYRRETYADSWSSSEDERDGVEEVEVSDRSSCLHAPDDDLFMSVNADISLGSTDCITVDVPSAGFENQSTDNETCTEEDLVVETVSLETSSLTVKEIENHESQGSAGYKELMEERPENSEAGAGGGEGEIDDVETAEEVVQIPEVGLTKPSISDGATLGTTVPELRNLAEINIGCEDSSLVIGIHASEFGHPAAKEWTHCDSFDGDGPHSYEGRGQLDERVSLGGSSANSNTGETAEHHLIVEGAESTKPIPPEQNLLSEQMCAQEQLSAQTYAPEASESGREEDSLAGKAEDIAKYDSRVSGSEPLSASGKDVGGKWFDVVIEGEVEAVVGKDSAECLNPLSASSSLLSAICSPNVLVTESAYTRFDEDENVRSGLELISSDDGYLRLEEISFNEGHDEQDTTSEVHLPQMSSDSSITLLSDSEQYMEEREPQPVQTNRSENENLSDACQVPTSAADEDFLKEEMLFELPVCAEQIDMETGLSIPTNSGSPERVQHPSDVQKAAVTDEEESYQECISHDSNSLSISRSSITASSEQETYSAGTHGTGEEEQEETSQMQFFSSSSSVGEGFESHSQQEISPDRSIEDPVTLPGKTGFGFHSHQESMPDEVIQNQVTVPEKIAFDSDSHQELMPDEGWSDLVIIPQQMSLDTHFYQESLPNKSSQDQLIIPEKTGVVDTSDPPSSFSCLNPSEESTATVSSIGLESDMAVEAAAKTLAEETDQVDREELLHSPIQSTDLEDDTDSRTCAISEADMDRSLSPQDGLAVGHVAYNGDSNLLRDEVGAVDSPRTERLLESVEGQSANLSADSGERPLSASVSETRLPLSDRDDLLSIDDNAWDEQPAEQKSSESSSRRWDPAESLKLSDKPHSGNGPEQPDFQTTVLVSGSPWNMTQSPSQNKMPVTGDGGDLLEKPKDSQGDFHNQSMSSGKEEAERSSFQTEVSSSFGDALTGKAAAEVEERKVKNEGDSSSDSGISGSSVVGDKLGSVGSQSARKLPISKAKSVRTISLTHSSQNELSPDGRLSPDGAVSVFKSTGYTSVTVVSPENLKWEPSTTGVAVHGDMDDSACAGNEFGKWNPQGVNSSPASVRRALALMGQQASPNTTDAYLQSPPSQVFDKEVKAPAQDGILKENAAGDDKKISAITSPPKLAMSPTKGVKGIDAPAPTVFEVSPKKDATTRKASKAKCSCTIM